MAHRNSSQVVLAWLPEDLVKQRGDTASLVEMELREAEGLHGQDAPTSHGSSDELHGESVASDRLCVFAPEPPAISHTLGDIYSVKVVPPTVSNWYGSLLVSLNGGESLPPLYFHDDESRSTLLGMHRSTKGDLKPPSSTPSAGSSSSISLPSASSPSGHSGTVGHSSPPAATWGGDELVQQLRKYSLVHRSVHDHSVFLINPQPQDLEAHSTQVFADDAIDPPQQPGDGDWSQHYFPDDPFAPTYPMSGLAGGASRPQTRPDEGDALASWTKATRMSLLTTFSHVTRSARDASRQLMEHPVVTNAQQQYQRRLAERRPTAAQSYANAGPLGPFGRHSTTATGAVDDMAERAGVAEYDSARVYLAKWARLVAEEGERSRRREEKAQEGKEPSGGQHSQVEHSGLGVFELLDYPDGDPHEYRDYRAIARSEWASWAAAGVDGRPTMSFDQVKGHICKRGLAVETRRAAWPILLGVDNWRATTAERTKDQAQRREAWTKLRAAWVAPDDGNGKSSEDAELTTMTAAFSQREDIQEQRHRIKVDCLRTDRKMPYFTNRNSNGASAPAGTSNGNAKTSEGQASHGESSNLHTAALAEILLTYSIYDALFYSGEASIREQSSVCCELSPLQLARMATGKSVRDSDLGGYVQGMSDLCSVLYVVCEADACETFWCFVALMKRMRPNFLSSQVGMKSELLHLQTLVRLCDRGLYDHLDRTGSLNLFFCFRWLLVRFKRECDLEGVQRIWECGFALEAAERDKTSEPEDVDAPSDVEPTSSTAAAPAPSPATTLAHTNHFHLFVCLALLTSHRSVVIDHLRAFDEILQYFQGLGLGTSSASTATTHGGASAASRVDAATETTAGTGDASAADVETSIRQAILLVRAVADKVSEEASGGAEGDFRDVADLVRP
ncbi:unnamed protein product [Parajaminaea phylloscopi]